MVGNVAEQSGGFTARGPAPTGAVLLMGTERGRAGAGGCVSKGRLTCPDPLHGAKIREEVYFYDGQAKS